MNKCATLGKMRHNWKNMAYLKAAPRLQKCAHLEKGGALGTRQHTWKIARHMEKWATFVKNAAHFKKCATLGRIRHT